MRSVENPSTPGRRLKRPGAVQDVWGIPAGYLAKLRCNGTGPDFLRIGGRVFYEDDAIDGWLATLRRSSTSDPGPTGKRAAIDEAKAAELGGD